MSHKFANRITLGITVLSLVIVIVLLSLSGATQPAASGIERSMNIFMSVGIGFLFWGWIPVLIIGIVSAMVTEWFVKKE